MRSPSLPRIRLNLRAKILLLLLLVSLISLAVTGFFAFSAISTIGTFSQGSSQVLGEHVVNESTAALTNLGEEYLLRIATDQAVITDVLFEDTDSEMDILAAYTAEAQRNPASTPIIPVYPRESPPADPMDGAVLVFAPGATAMPGSDEARVLAGMSDLLKGVYMTDENMTSIYVGTDSGMMLIYPGTANIPAGYDPRTRDWYRSAAGSDQNTWSRAPYVDAAGHGLIMTCSRAVSSQQFGHWVIGSDVSVNTINDNFLNRTLGGGGEAVLLGSDGTVISRPGLTAGAVGWDEPFPEENAFTSDNSGLVAVARNMTAGKTGIEQVMVNGNATYIAYAPVPSMNWSLAVAIPVNRITQPVQDFAGRIAGVTKSTGETITSQAARLRTVFAILFFMILAIVIVIAVVLTRIITRPVESLKRGTFALGKGDLDYRLMIQSGDEFEDLACSFNTMAEDLKTNIENLRRTTAEKERYTKELEIARDIQASFLPASVPQIPGFDIAAVAIPAMEVGGDFYDFVPMSGDRLAFVIADVSGKGVSAALFMAMSRTLIRASLEGQEDPAAALREANRLIARDAQSGMFVTAFTAVLEPSWRTLACVSAGHNPPLIVHGDTGEAVFLHERGIAMGILDDMESTAEILQLRLGDMVVMYTDGVTEAINPEFAAFGEERLTRSAVACRQLAAPAVIEHILSDLQAFTGTAPQSDDITLIVIRVP
jgi:sigma-B regulation protein RsbU (phosphoserine phosphatase)